MRDDDALFRKLKTWYREDIKRVAEWRKEAKESFAFRANDQWSAEDRKELEAKSRPAVSFDKIAPLVNAIVGSEINNRREVQYIPREEGDAIPNEILTSAGEWFRDETGAEDEESDAFEDNVISGMGWTDTRLDFATDPDGAPVIERIDCMEMVWDCNAQKPNLVDATRLSRVRELTYEQAKELIPGVDPKDIHAAWAKTLTDDPETPHDQEKADDYDGSQDDEADKFGHETCTVVEMRWLESEPYWRGEDYQNPGQIREYSEQQALVLQKFGLKVVKQTRKVVRRAFLGNKILKPIDSPLAPPGMLGWECMTGYRDKAKKQFFGVVRAAKDPQRWTNKFFSQVMYLLNSQSKGGIGAERGAFENDREAEASWAKADEITWFTKGALSGPSPKFIPKPQANFPAGFFTLFQESKEEVHQSMGLSPEFVGTREVDQAGVLEMQRRQASLNVLASLFNSLRRYRKRQGRIMLHLIQQHLSDGRLIRIVGEGKKEYVPLTKEAVASAQYDIIVDDAPTSPNEKERVWSILQSLFPFIKDMLGPDEILEMMKYSPLPASMVDKLTKKRAEQAQQPQPPSPEEIKAKSAEQMAAIKAQESSQQLQFKERSAQIDQEMKAIDLMAKKREDDMAAIRDQRELQVDLANLAIKEEANRIAAQRANAKQVSAAQG